MKEKRTLTAKQYLMQLKYIDEVINQDIERLSEMKSSAMSTGAIDYSKDRVQTSPADKLSSDVSRYTVFNEHINREIDSFVDAKNQIIKEIRELRDVNYIQVLYKVYVQFKSLKVTAYEMRKSYTFVRDAHKKALKEFERVHKNLIYLQ